VHEEADAMLAEDQKVMSKILGSARRKLLETGTRNRLIHVNRANQRANCLNVINERSDEIYRILRRDGKRMRFRAMGKDKFDVESEPSLATPDVDLGVESERFTDNVIETPLGPEALARRLLGGSGRDMARPAPHRGSRFGVSHGNRVPFARLSRSGNLLWNEWCRLSDSN
jgi:hypothetical protein